MAGALRGRVEAGSEAAATMIRAPHLGLATTTRAAPRRLLIGITAGLIAINLIAFRRAIGWGVFYQADSDVMLRVAEAADWRQALGWITGPWLGAPLCLYYRPTSSWLIWGEWALFGDSAAGYQWVSMALHVSAVLLFWRIAVKLLGGETPGAVAALIFSLRPRNVRTLAVLTAQPGLAAAVFMFASLLGLIVYARSSSPWRGAMLAASLAAAVLALGGKEVALSLPALATLIVLFDPDLPRRRKAWLLAAFWATFAAFMVGRSFAMSGLGYLPEGWRDPRHAISALARTEGLYLAHPFAVAVLTRDWWPGAMLVVIGLYAVGARRWPALRSERALVYVTAPIVIGAAVGFSALCYDNWAAALTLAPWRLLGSMALYVIGAMLLIARDRRAALFIVLWGLCILVPAAYRVYNWSGYFFYLPQTFWALTGALVVEALVARRRAGRRIASCHPASLR